MPLAWTRHHTTLPRTAPGPLGWGATHGFDHALRLERESLQYVAPDGIVVRFEGAADARTLVARVGRERWVRERRDEQSVLVHSPDESALEFRVAPAGTTEARFVALRRTDGTLHLRHDAQGRLRAVLDPAGRMLRLDYDGAGRVQRVALTARGAAERVLAEYGYDARGDLVRVLDAYGTTHTRVYDPAHRCIRHTDSWGRAFSFEYDALGRCSRASGDDALLSTRFEYRPAARRTEVTTAAGGTWIAHYDEDGFVTELEDPARVRVPLVAPVSDVISYRKAEPWAPPSAAALAWGKLLDEEERRPDIGSAWLRTLPREAKAAVSAATEPVSALESSASPGLETRQSSLQEHRDELGRLTCEVRTDGSRKEWLYAGPSRVTRVVDGRGGATEFEFAHGAQLAVLRDALGNTTRLAWSREDRVATVIDPNGERAELRYDLRGRCVGLRDGRRRVERYGYDRRGRLVELRDAERVLVFRQSYTHDSRAMTRAYADGVRLRFCFDAENRVEHIEDALDSLRFAYDERGERVSDLRDGRGVEHEHKSPAGSRTTVLGRYVMHTRVDDEGTVHVTDPTGAVHRVRRPGTGVVVSEFADGYAELAQYDPQGRCLAKSAYDARVPGAGAWQRAYLRDGEGALIEARDSARGTRWFDHDRAGRLVHTRDAHGRETHFAHDPAGNVHRGTDTGSVRWGADHQLLEHRGVHFTDDARGRRASRASAAQAPVQYRYDAHDRLVGIDGLPEAWSARYDALGRRVEKRVSEARTRFWWDGDRLAAIEFPNRALRIYVYPDPYAWVPLLWIDYDGPDVEPSQGLRYYPFGDALGAPLEVRDARGLVVWQARLDPYGHAKVDPASTHVQPLRRPGEYADPEAGGLVSQGTRTWDPATARYLQPLLDGSTLACSPYVGPASPISDVLLAGRYPTALHGLFAQHDRTEASRAAPQDTLLAALFLPIAPTRGSRAHLAPDHAPHRGALEAIPALALVQVAPPGRTLDFAQREALGFTAEPPLRGAREALVRRLVSTATDALAREDPRTARALFEQVCQVATAGGHHTLSVSVRISVAGLALDAGDVQSALEHYRQAASRAEQRGLPLLAWQAQVGVARAAERGRLVADAGVAHERAAQIAERAGLREEHCESLCARGSHLLAHGNEPDALAAWTRAFETGTTLSDEAWSRGSLPETHRRMIALLERRGLHTRIPSVRAYLRTPVTPPTRRGSP